MIQFRWPIIVITCMIAIALFFGANHYRQRFLEEEPFIEALQQMDGIEEAVIVREGGEDVLLVTPDSRYRGTLQELIVSVKEKARQKYRKPVRLEIEDYRNEQLEQFARRVAPDLYEAARLHNYRSVAQSIGAAAEEFRLEGLLFAVDHERIYLQARDGNHYLFEMILLERDEGGGA